MSLDRTQEYVVYGSSISLFTRKLESALRFYEASFRSERKGPENGPTIEQRAGTHQVPVLHTPENWMIADTTPILAMLDARFPARRLIPEGPLGVLVNVVEEVLDEWIARTMVHYRWHYDENTRHVVAGFLGREVTIEEAHEFPIAKWGPRACRATGTESRNQREAVERELGDKLGCLRSVFLAAPKHLDPLQHVDTMLAFTDPENAVLSMPTLYEGDLGAEYQNVRQLLELGYRVHRIPRKTASVTYTNVLVTRKHVYVPQYAVYKVEADAEIRAEADSGPSVATLTLPADADVTHDNRTALEVFRRLYPDRRVVGVDSNETIDTLGSWHCISHELPEAL